MFTPSRPGLAMNAYQFFIDDDRYKVATLVIELATDVNHARQQAGNIATRSPHYVRVRVFDEVGAALFTVSAGRDAA
jgi:hypothetical protein